MLFTNLMRNDPFDELHRIQHEMNRLFNGIGVQSSKTYPALNIWSNVECAFVTAELPGYEPKDFNASVVGDMLVLNGERKSPEIGKNDVFQRQERAYGRFERSIRLPFPVESDKISATFRDGVLNITLPRSEDDKPRRIEIQSR